MIIGIPTVLQELSVFNKIIKYFIRAIKLHNISF